VRDIVKKLTVSRLEIRHRMEGKYQLELTEPNSWREARSHLSLTVEDMIRFGLDPGEDLVGSSLELRLKAIPYSWETKSQDTVLITNLFRKSEVAQLYSMIPPKKSIRRTCWLEAKTPTSGGSLVVLPSTYYDINLLLTEGEYRRLQALPAGTALEASLRQADRNYRDYVIKYRGTLDEPRIFPQDYVPRMITLVKKMIDYFDGDVDVVSHHCALELWKHELQSKKDKNQKPREYFAFKPLSPDDWEKEYVDCVSRADAVLKERFDNRLPIFTVHEFYDNIETSIWERTKSHSIEELSVGLEAKYVSRDSYHLPSIVIESRSVFGNRKACEAACEALSREAVKLFGVKFDHLSLKLEDFRSSSKKVDSMNSDVSTNKKINRTD